jgi:two-component sensor histidine kinase
MESAGPPVVAPAHKGFGTTVITKMAAMNLDGETHLDYASSGLFDLATGPVKTFGRENEYYS